MKNNFFEWVGPHLDGVFYGNNMDRSWMNERRISEEYENEVYEFLQYA